MSLNRGKPDWGGRSDMKSCYGGGFMRRAGEPSAEAQVLEPPNEARFR